MSDVEVWTRFGSKALGMMADDHGPLRRLRLDEKGWRFALHEDPADDILYAGFECDGLTDLSARRDALASEGIQCTSLNEAELSEREVDAGFFLADPDGMRLELVVGHKNGSVPFHSDLTSGFVTGEQGLGHIVLSITDLEASIAFYQKLGFALSDFITQQMGPAALRIAFMHCNERHHSLAMAALPGDKRLNHIMIECEQVDDVLLAYRRCLEQGYKAGAIGRHPNDEMLSFYAKTPAGFDVECGWGGMRICGDWSVKEYDRISIWGHEPAE
ncbi:MAG: VOC family protein [Novosphingobium sp.]